MPLQNGPTTPATAIPEKGLKHPRWQRLAKFLNRRRVRITGFVLFILIAEDVLEGLKPRSIINIQSFYSMLGVALVFAGVAVRSWAAGILHKNSQLTTNGPYGIVRHPLYIGSLMTMLGFCTLINDTENIWFILGPILGLLIYRAIQEERKMAQRFGRDWEVYARSVPRFIPRRWPKAAFDSWDRNQWVLNREYQMVGAVMLGLIGLHLWRHYA